MDKILLPEKNKRPGVCYALTRDGVELAVVDVTHPAFAVSITPAEQQAQTAKFVEDSRRLVRFPRTVRDLLLRFVLRGSVLAKGIRQARGTFMSGMDTYLLKLGPEMLGEAYAKPIDRRIAAGLPVLGVRLRVQDMAGLMADALAPGLLADAKRPLCFVNIAGGPAIDSLNALILLRAGHPGILAERRVEIIVLDRDDAGAAFGAAALAALSADGAPLHGTRSEFRHVFYDWGNAEDLKPALNEAQSRGALVTASSEGGLFEYGSDGDIAANLATLRAYPEVAAVAGSVTRDDEAQQMLHGIGSAATRPRGLAVFRELIRETGWKVAREIERPFSDQVLLS